MKQFFLTLILFLSLATPAWATVYWVSFGGTGSDSNACSAIDSVSEAVDPGTYKLTILSASACASPGDMILVKAGVSTSNQFTTTVAGTSGVARITYKSQTLRGAILRPSGGEFIWSNEGNFVTVEGFDFDGSNTAGANRLPMNNQATNFSFINNKVHDFTMSVCTGGLSGGGGMGLSNSSTATTLIATGNEIFNMGLASAGCGPGVHGIYNASSGGGSIQNNLVHNVRDSNILIYPNATTAVTVSGNITHHGNHGLWILNGSGHVVYNNLSYSNSSEDIFIQPANGFYYNNTALGAIVLNEFSSGNTVRNNIALGGISNSGSGNTINTNTTTGTAASHFADSANGDFRLCSEDNVPTASCNAASTAVGAGVDLSGVFTTDIVGSLRNVPWDIGAYKAVSQAPTPPTPALVLQISCDNVVTDSSGFANHGTLTNGATYNASGKYSAACSFDGMNDHVLVADSTSLDTTHGFTLEAWVKPAAPLTTDQAVIQKAAGVDGTYYVQASSTGICGTGAPMAGYQQGSNVTACYATPLTDSVWTHLSVSYDPTGTPNVRLYLNAVEVTNAAGSATLTANAGSLFIGSADAAASFFNGLIDEIRIYNYARSPAQIADDMNTPINVLAAPSNLTIGASATGMQWGASATALKIVGSLTAVPVVQVAYDATSESHTGTTGNTSSASFSWTHTPVGAPAGVLVFTFNANSNASDATSVTYGGDSLTQVPGGLASDTATEPGSCEAWFVGTSVPTGAQTVLVNRTNNANIMYAVAITVTASTDVAVIGTPVLQENNGALAQSSIDSGAVIAQRFACAYHGGNAIPAAGANSTILHTIDFGVFTAGVARETTPGSGNRPAGMTSVSDDRAQVVLAIGIP